jgi:hypothetical protein
MIEIVGVLIVAEQHGIDRPDRFRAQGRACGLLQRHMRQAVLAGSVERRIGQQAKAVDFEQGGWATDA